MKPKKETLKMPTDAEKTVTANVLRNILNLLKHGMFFGANAGYVHEAIAWIEQVTKNIDPAQAAPTEEKAAKLEVVDGKK